MPGSSLPNPLGFSSTDFAVGGLAALLVALLLSRRWMIPLARKLADRPLLAMATLSALPLPLRAALLAHHPIPTPSVADDFSYLLLGDTLAHFRLANPVHPFHRFFEAVFVLQEPSYASIFPLGQGVVLAFGQLVFRQPWVGVALSVSALCALVYWMLRAWIGPLFALAGGLLAVLQFGPLSPWMNTYWGGAVSGVAGCLVFGALPRLRHTRRMRDAILLGAGLSLQLLTRPFEFLLLAMAVLLFFAPVRSLAIAGLVLLPAAGLTLLQNKQVTGSWTTLPYQLNQYEYGIPTSFTFQPVPSPHRPLTIEQKVDYDSQAAIHGQQPENLSAYLKRLGRRIGFLRFFFLPPLYLALPAFFPALRRPRYVWVVLTLVLFWMASGFYPYFYPHYLAAATCLFLLVSVKGLEQLSRVRIRARPAGKDAAVLIYLLSIVYFCFWYGAHLLGNPNLLLALRDNEGVNSIDYGDPEGRIAINNQLEKAGGRQLVFVRYSARHGATEWIHNAAEIDAAPVVWALDLGDDENVKLRRYYRDRRAWLLEPDNRPPRLTPY